MAIEIVDLPINGMVIFNSKLWNFQRVNIHFPMVFPLKPPFSCGFSYGFPIKSPFPCELYPPTVWSESDAATKRCRLPFFRSEAGTQEYVLENSSCAEDSRRKHRQIHGETMVNSWKNHGKHMEIRRQMENWWELTVQKLGFLMQCSIDFYIFLCRWMGFFWDLLVFPSEHLPQWWEVSTCNSTVGWNMLKRLEG